MIQTYQFTLPESGSKQLWAGNPLLAIDQSHRSRARLARAKSPVIDGRERVVQLLRLAQEGAIFVVQVPPASDIDQMIEPIKQILTKHYIIGK